MKGEGQQKARGLGAFRGESRRRACYSSRIWGQFPSPLFFLEPLLLPLKRLPRCSAPPAGSRAPGDPPGPQGGWPSSSGGCESRCRTVRPRPRFFPFSPSSSLCFPNAAAGRCAQASREVLSFLPSFSCPPRLLQNTIRLPLHGRTVSAFPDPPQGFPGGGGERAPGNLWSCSRAERLAPGERAGAALGVWPRTFVFPCGRCAAPSREGTAMLSGNVSGFRFLGGNMKS